MHTEPRLSIEIQHPWETPDLAYGPLLNHTLCLYWIAAAALLQAEGYLQG